MGSVLFGVSSMQRSISKEAVFGSRVETLPNLSSAI
jgi:hypothetical protein